MATFYVLPPRECLERAVTDLFAKLLPGLPLPVDAWGLLADQLGAAGGWEPDVFLVPRDELADGDTAGALTDGYGAEAGDRVVEVSLARPSRAWALQQADVSGAAVAR
ncbi:hypothetical protein GobsT_03330 [Gemmata obscuriglobus]|uniref:Uncharacterized protein n=1 Tax=Gemmata obscuriglobus TaxID=114 RepID=A0A2Z3H5Q2_9BACT|nr:hypothetical protein [Gemmata obscuriglobus]AWM41068.1 hypothetical protein C1280_31495 [Gemmata obscuriglobus]QEG25606.1 hypothetical protein GobsT_03330 [Gemmata obscuriglobus]VTR99088.1 unnamed protein product [Gemmata obscuriglobus UQM 2246]